MHDLVGPLHYRIGHQTLLDGLRADYVGEPDFVALHKLIEKLLAES